MSKLIDLTNNIRLLEFEPPHFASEKYLEAFKTIETCFILASYTLRFRGLHWSEM